MTPITPKKTTVIIYNTLLNYPRLKEYWTALTEEGLLMYDIPTQTFKTTEIGLRFLEVFSELDQNQRRRTITTMIMMIIDFWMLSSASDGDDYA